MDARRGFQIGLAGLASAVASLACAVSAGAAVTYPSGFSETPLAKGLTAPTTVSWAPDGRMFVLEKSGRLLVVPNGSSTPKQVLSIPEKVNSAGDRGMLGLAVDSQYDKGYPYVYVLYSKELDPDSPDQESRAAATLLRLKIDGSSAVTETKEILGTGPSSSDYKCPTPTNDLDCIPSDAQSHSIGTVRSAPDGTLYLGAGDGSGAGEADPEALGTQDELSMRGKIMHVDRDGKGVTGHPYCPGDTNLSHVCTKLYAKGFRNPYRFQLLADGRLAVGDVGWNTTEELDLVPVGGGKNYGWPCYEGNDHAPGYEDMPECVKLYKTEHTATAAAPPAFSYEHGRFGNAVIGGPVYTGSTGQNTSYPAAYRDRLFFADYVGEDPDDDGQPDGYIKTLGLTSTGLTGPALPFMSGESVVAVEKAPNGNFVYVAPGGYDFPAGAGQVREIRYGSGNRTPSAVASASPTAAKPGQAIAFDGSRSSDPDQDTLKYSWNFGDNTAVSTEAKPSHTYAKAGCYATTLTVTDPKGATASATVTVPVAATPLSASIAPTAPYQDGKQVTLNGSVAGGTKPSEVTQTWNVVLHHKAHTHPMTGQVGGSTFTFTARDDHDSDSYYEVELTATDPNAKCGSQSGTASVKTSSIVKPETHPLTIHSDPAGAPLSWSGQTSTAGFSYAAATGFKATVSAPAAMTQDGHDYEFTGWSDGGAVSHTVTVPAAALDLVAHYRPLDDNPDPGDPGTGDPDPAPILPAPEPGGQPISPLRPQSTPTPRRGARPDRTPPRFSRIASHIRRSPYMTGHVTDGSGIKKVDVFLAAQAAPKAPCQFWSDRTRTLGRLRSCKKPVWMRAKLTRDGRSVAWRVRPWTTPEPGRWLARVRAVDRKGNTATDEYVLLVRSP